MRRYAAPERYVAKLHPSDATWAGVYDRTDRHTPDESRRRAALSAEFGGGAHA
jgi:hypothetical protein